MSRLPTFEGKNVIEIINEAIRSEQNEISILDVGAGAACFLGELGLKYPKIKLYGAAAVDSRARVGNIPESIIKAAKKVDYRVGDLQKLENLFRNIRFDIITTVYTLLYLGDPLNVIKQMYKLLKPGGFAFIDQSGIFMSTKVAELLRNYWAKMGIRSDMALVYPQFPGDDFGEWKLVVCKKRGKENLPLPFRWNKNSQDWELDPKIK